MNDYRPRIPRTVSGTIRDGSEQSHAATALGRLLPLPGAEVLWAPLSLLSERTVKEATEPLQASQGVMPEAVAREAASIVSQAASILDEEMARGVLSARRAATPGPYGAGAEAANPVLRQVHELVDSLASMWPVPAPAAPASGADDVAEVRSHQAVRPGGRATVSLALRNRESRPVHLTPVVTELLGSRGGRIPVTRLELSPSEVLLQPDEHADVTIDVVVPDDAAPGCYSGLLVVRGVEYLRALVTIEVA